MFLIRWIPDFLFRLLLERQQGWSSSCLVLDHFDSFSLLQTFQDDQQETRLFFREESSFNIGYTVNEIDVAHKFQQEHHSILALFIIDEVVAFVQDIFRNILIPGNCEDEGIEALGEGVLHCCEIWRVNTELAD